MRRTCATSPLFTDAPLGQLARRVILRRCREFLARPAQACGCWAMALPFPICAAVHRGRTRHRRHAGAPGRASPGRDGKNATLVCEEDALPFPDVFFDRILIVHGLEVAESLRAAAAPALAGAGAGRKASCWWRPTAPACGRRCKVSPFGHGRPFSRMELERLAAATRCSSRSAGRARCMRRLSTAVSAYRHGLGKDGRAAVSRHRRRACGGSGQVALCRRRRRAEPAAGAQAVRAARARARTAIAEPSSSSAGTRRPGRTGWGPDSRASGWRA